MPQSIDPNWTSGDDKEELAFPNAAKELQLLLLSRGNEIEVIDEFLELFACIVARNVTNECSAGDYTLQQLLNVAPDVPTIGYVMAYSEDEDSDD